MPQNTSSGDSIDWRFRRIVTTIYVVLAALVAWRFVDQWQGYWDAHEAQSEFVAVQATLRTMAAISGERRPAFDVLQRNGSASVQQIEALKKARQATDLRLEELQLALGNADCRSCAAQMPALKQARADLMVARQQVDVLAVRPQDRLPYGRTLFAFDHLVNVMPQLLAIASATSMGVIRENADVQSYLLASRLAARLCEQAGLLSYHLVPALEYQRTLTEEESFDMGRALGGIEQLRGLLGTSVRGLSPQLKNNLDEIDKRYFGVGVAYVEQLRSQARRSGVTDTTTDQFLDRYSPTLTPIDNFRDAALALTGQTIQNSLRWHLILLLGAGLFAAMLTAVLLILIWRFRQKIIRPFVEARRSILAIASGDTSVAIPQSGYIGEIKDMFGALAVLRANDAQRLKLEKERKRLIGELREMAETDPLTGLLNRRAFESRTEVMLEDQRGSELFLAMIMLDIDFFKRINDTYGHDSGDRALVKFANVCRDTVRVDDIVARFGGEEFVVLLRVGQPSQALELAERLRQRLRHEKIIATNGEVFSFTASLGIAFARRADAPDIADMLQRADALLYQAKTNGRDRIEAEAIA
jgi:diguanylate cyclase (GGDEF)-like protein